MPSRLRTILLIALGVVVVALVARWLWFTAPSPESMARSRQPAVRLDGVRGLVDEDRPATQATLRELAHDQDPRVARAAIDGLSRYPNGDNYDFLRGILIQADDPVRRGEAAAALGRFEQTNPNDLQPLLAEARPVVERVGAARGLARMRRREAVPILYRALYDPDAHVRAWAIQGIQSVMLWRFAEYDASKPADQQQRLMHQIEDELRQRGLLK